MGMTCPKYTAETMPRSGHGCFPHLIDGSRHTDTDTRQLRQICRRCQSGLRWILSRLASEMPWPVDSHQTVDAKWSKRWSAGDASVLNRFPSGPRGGIREIFSSSPNQCRYSPVPRDLGLRPMCFIFKRNEYASSMQ